MTDQDMFLTFAISMTVNYALNGLRSLSPNSKISQLEAKINYLYRKTGITFDSFEGISPDIRRLLENGRKIQAIALYRRSTNCSLKESKDAIESILRGEGLPETMRRP